MCLVICDDFGPSQRQRQIKNLFGQKKEIVAYKVYCVLEKGRLYPMYYSDGGPVKAGIIRSNRKSIKLDRLERKYQEVNRGIHVYLRTCHLTRLYWNSRFYRVVPVICHVDDFVRAEGNTEAVFMKVRTKRNDRFSALKQNPNDLAR